MDDLFLLPFLNTTEDEQPSVTFKLEPEDFQVFELMDVEPLGEGEHIWLDVLKKEKNTQDLARDLARHFNVAKNAVAYSGLKDKNAVTRQWFSVHIPGKTDPSLPVFRNVDFLKKVRHNKKLKTGVHQGNRFVIRLRDVSDLSVLEKNLARVKAQGFPNYFGHQRFGFDRGNLEKAQEWLITGKRPRQRFLEGMYLSALRSYIFNIALSGRVESQRWNVLTDGEIAQDDWSKSGVVVKDENKQNLDQQCLEGDVNPAINLFDGRQILPEPLAALAEQDWFEKFKKNRFSPEQRALRIMPRDVSWHQIEDTKDIDLTFELPTGSYATSLLKEVCILNEPERDINKQLRNQTAGDA